MTNPADWSQQVAFYAGRLAEMTRERDNEQKRAEQAEAERDEARAWVKDLHSGMYINCVYCGHRYGPKEDTPSSMADVLKAHVEQCPQHPMSALKAQLATVEADLAALRTALAAKSRRSSGEDSTGGTRASRFGPGKPIPSRISRPAAKMPKEELPDA